ncbi:MAG: acetyl-CoA C-acetyltransferase [Bradymonadia bacterium]
MAAYVLQYLVAEHSRSEIDDILLGCSTASGEQGADIARIAALMAGLIEAPGATISRFCTSGLDAVALAAAKVASGAASLTIAGGVESTSRVPMFADGGDWFADTEVASETGFVHMGVSADLLATLAGLERGALDAYAQRSHQRAAEARDGAMFKSLRPVELADVAFAQDELIRDGISLSKLASLTPAFDNVGGDNIVRSRYPEIGEVRRLHTVGTSPSLADGACALYVGDEEGGAKLGAVPRARIVGSATHAVEPVLMLTGNVECTRKALRSAGMELGDIDVFEVNESFAAVPLHYSRELCIDESDLNVFGGAIAMGHALGATGAMLVLTALDVLEQRDANTAVVSICGGAGVATTLVLERV